MKTIFNRPRAQGGEFCSQKSSRLSLSYTTPAHLEFTAAMADRKTLLMLIEEDTETLRELDEIETKKPKKSKKSKKSKAKKAVRALSPEMEELRDKIRQDALHVKHKAQTGFHLQNAIESIFDDIHLDSDQFADHIIEEESAKITEANDVIRDALIKMVDRAFKNYKHASKVALLIHGQEEFQCNIVRVHDDYSSDDNNSYDEEDPNIRPPFGRNVRRGWDCN